MRKARILLVDDEAIVRNSVSEWLKNDAYEVECASNGIEALEKFSGDKFDTAVVDLKMPGIDGLEVMKRIKKVAPQTRVIIITAYGNTENAVEAMKWGASDFLPKPFTMDKLEQVIEQTATKDSVATVEAPPAPPATAPVEEVKEKAKPKTEKQCIWSKAGVVSYKVCSNNFRCDSCEFAQSMMDKGAQVGDRPMMMDAMKKMLEKPGPERSCRYMLSGQINYKLCSNVYRCAQCSFNEFMEDKLDVEAAKMTAKIKGMQERKAKKAATN